MTMYRTDPAVEALRPGDDGYEDAARVFVTTGRPAVIVRPRNVAEVASAITLARRDGRTLSVRSGGHSPLGHGTNTGGVVIDLAHLDGVQVLDAGRRLVRIGAGATWGRVSAVLDSHGWALTAGDTASVGVGGLTLGGGFGWMVRRYGLAIDHLVGARVVTADGRLLTASDKEHPDLFWALRGGGGNFGVVVDLDFLAQPVATVHFGSVSYRLDDVASLIARWRDAMRAIPEEVSSTLMLMPRMPGAPASARVLLCCVADPGADDFEVDTEIDPLLGIGTVTEAHIRECRYPEILEDGSAPPGLRMVLRNTLVPDLDDATIAAITRLHDAGGPTAVAIRSLGGAFGRVSPYATAFAHRDAEAMIVCAAMLPRAASDADVRRVLEPWRPVAAHGTGSYLGFQGSAGAADIAAVYPPATYDRLARVKRAYDPGNVFRLNHNIEPGFSVGRRAPGGER